MGYHCDENGNVFNANGRKLKPFIYLKYPTINSRIDGKVVHVHIHRIQAFQKYGKSIFDKGIVVRHLNGNKMDTSLGNISIGTQRDNIMDMPQNQRKEISSKGVARIRRFTNDIVDQIKQDRHHMSYSQLCIKYKTSKSTLSYLFNKSQYAM